MRLFFLFGRGYSATLSMPQFLLKSTGVSPLASMGAEPAPMLQQLPSFSAGKINQCSPKTSRPSD